MGAGGYEFNTRGIDRKTMKPFVVQGECRGKCCGNVASSTDSNPSPKMRYEKARKVAAASALSPT